MANEWVAVELYGPNNDGGKRRFTIADGASVSIGTLLQLLDPRTASLSHVVEVAIAGVAAEEHIANKGITSISVWTDGIFEVSVSGAVTLGAGLVSDKSLNHLKSFSPVAASSSVMTFASYAFVCAKAYETGSDGEVINVRLGPL